MKSLVLSILLVGSLCVPAVAEFRTLVSNDGKSLKAELVSHDGEKVTIRREDGKEFAVDPAIFCDQDRDALLAWMKENGPKVEYRLRADATKKSARQSEHSDSWYYEIKVRNNGQDAVKDITVLYRVLYERHGRSRMEEGEHLLTQELKFNRTLVINSDTITVYRGRTNRNDGIRGCLIRVIDPEGNVVVDWASNDLGMKDVTWESTTPKDDHHGPDDKVEIR